MSDVERRTLERRYRQTQDPVDRNAFLLATCRREGCVLYRDDYWETRSDCYSGPGLGLLVSPLPGSTVYQKEIEFIRVCTYWDVPGMAGIHPWEDWQFVVQVNGFGLSLPARPNTYLLVDREKRPPVEINPPYSYDRLPDYRVPLRPAGRPLPILHDPPTCSYLQVPSFHQTDFPHTIHLQLYFRIHYSSCLRCTGIS